MRIHQRLGHSDQIPSQCCGTFSNTRTSEIVDKDALLGAEPNGTTSWSTQGRCQPFPIQLSIAACPPGTGYRQRRLAPTLGLRPVPVDTTFAVASLPLLVVATSHRLVSIGTLPHSLQPLAHIVMSCRPSIRHRCRAVPSEQISRDRS
jgi:hypothetical protein